MVIKSTVPVGHARTPRSVLQTGLFFRQNFCERSSATRHPSRIIMGCSEELGAGFFKLLLDAADKKDVETLFMPSTEASRQAVCQYLLSHACLFLMSSTPTPWPRGWIPPKSLMAFVLMSESGAYNNPSFWIRWLLLTKDTKQL